VSTEHNHCPFGSVTFEASSGRAVVSNRLASITKFANTLTTWLHEIKHDGFRVIARKDGAACMPSILVTWRNPRAIPRLPSPIFLLRLPLDHGAVSGSPFRGRKQ
jgi:hypothetical protein